MDLFQRMATPIVARKYKSFYNSLAYLSKKSYRYEVKRNLLKEDDILIDKQQKEIIDYWKRYTKDFDISFHRYYINRTKNFDVRYIPDDLYAGYIDKYLNNREIESGIADKNYFDMYLKGFKMPKTYLHIINGQFLDANYNLINLEKAISTLLQYKSFIVKPSMTSYGGKNVCFFENYKYDDIKKYLENIKDGNLIFQETIKQHKNMSILHPNSVNTIRIMTLIINGEVQTLSSSLRLGVGKSKVDNASAGGIYCGINEKGNLTNFAYDSNGNRYEKHPDGVEFDKCNLPFMDKVKELVKMAAQRFPHFRCIGWDIAIDENGEPLIIEANLTMSSLDVVQTVGGPLFGQYTDEVLEEVFHNEKKDKKIFFDISQYI